MALPWLYAIASVLVVSLLSLIGLATLSISEQTVKNHMSSILRKLSVNDRTQAVVYAMRQGWIRMPED